MKIFSSPYLSRFFRITVLLLAVCVILFAATLLLLERTKQVIEDKLEARLGRPLSIGRIYYVPLNSFILTNVKSESPSDFDCFLFTAERAKVIFSLPALITRRVFSPHTVSFIRPRFDFSRCSPLYFILGKKYEGAPLQEAVRVILREGLFVFPKNKSRTAAIKGDAVIELDSEGNIESRGTFVSVDITSQDTTEKTSGKIPVVYDFRGTAARNMLTIENLEINRGAAHLKVWGDFFDNALKLNGILSLRDFFDDYKTVAATDVGSRFKRAFFKKYASSPQVMSYSKAGLTVYDLDCALRFALGALIIDHIDFSLNNIPFSLKGVISFLGQTGINIQFSSFPHQDSSSRFNNSKRFDFWVNGVLQGEKFTGNTRLQFLRETKTRQANQELDVDLEGASVFAPTSKHIGVRCDRADVRYSSGRSLYTVFLQDLRILCNIANKRFKYFTVASRIFDGDVAGSGLMDTQTTPFKNTFHFNVHNVSANKLETLVDHFSQVYGVFSGGISYQNYPSSHLYGDLIVRDGYLDDMMFFNWLADTFKIPSLKKLFFQSLSSHFAVNDEVSSLQGIFMNGKGVELNGYFDLLETGLVSSKLSLVFSEELLRSSRRFDYLLRLLGRDINLVSFDFQLSGLSEAMNFKWLKSDFKRRIQDLLPGRYERLMERKVEEAIEALAVKDSASAGKQ